MIKLNNLTKYFGKNCAVKNINLAIERGDLFALLGPNGAGKSTLLAIITGLITPSSGTVTIDGKDIATSKSSIMLSIGVSFENPSFYDYLSGRENAKLLAKLKGCYNKRNLDHLLQIVSLSSRADDAVKKYSLGMKQRLALVCALIGDPDILLLDEPTNGLDPEGIHETLALLSNLSKEKNKTIIISSHQVHDVESICNKIAILNKAVILRCGELEELLQKESQKKSCIITTDRVDDLKKALLDKPYIKSFEVATKGKSLKEFYLETIKKA